MNSKNGRFIHYPHIDKLKINENINYSEFRIFPKLDGSNCQINFNNEKNELIFGSRNRTVTYEDDHMNFVKKFTKNEDLKNFFKENHDLTLFGEYLVPNRKNIYKSEYDFTFIIFDVVKGGEYYLDYDEYKLLLDKFNLLYVEPLTFDDNQTVDELVSSFKTKYINENAHDEGVVIKKKGKQALHDGSFRMCKIICDEWSQIKAAKKNQSVNQNVQGLDENVFEELKATYCTMSYVNKELDKLFPQPISNDYKQDVIKFGKKKFMNLIMNDFIKIELANLRNTDHAKYIKRLTDCMVKNILNLF